MLRPDRVTKARLEADLSRADLAHAIRVASRGIFKATEGTVRRVERGEHLPRDGFGYLVALVTGKPIAFFYEPEVGEVLEVSLRVPAGEVEAFTRLARERFDAPVRVVAR